MWFFQSRALEQSKRRKRCVSFLSCGPAKLWRTSLPTVNWRPATHCLVARRLSVWHVFSSAPRSNKQRVHHVCVFIVFVSDELLAATRLQWGNCYANDMWQGYTELTQSQTFSPFSLFFTSFSLSVSEPSWQQLCGRKTLRRCFSMSLRSTVIQPWLLLPIVTSRDSFNMLLVSRDSAKILWQCESNDLLLPQILKPAMRVLLWFEMS